MYDAGLHLNHHCEYFYLYLYMEGYSHKNHMVSERLHCGAGRSYRGRDGIGGPRKWHNMAAAVCTVRCRSQSRNMMNLHECIDWGKLDIPDVRPLGPIW